MPFLSTDQLPDNLQAAIVHRYLTTGQTLFHQGDPTQAIFVVESGQIKLAHYTEAGQLIKHYEVSAGESFAEAALFNEVYDCTAIANAPSRVLVLPKQPFLVALENQPALSMKLMAQLAQRAHETKILLTLRSIRSPRDRVLHYLRLAAQFNPNTVHLQRPLKEIAEEIGLNPEVLSRALSRLQQEGVITRSRNKITLHC